MNVRWNQVAIAAAAGFLAGALFSDFYRCHRGPALPPRHAPGGPMELFSRELGLSREQQDKVSAVFAKYDPEMKKILETERPKLDAVREKMETELDAILTPGQLKKMEEIKKRFDGGPHGLPHGGPGMQDPEMRGRGPGGPEAGK